MPSEFPGLTAENPARQEEHLKKIYSVSQLSLELRDSLKKGFGELMVQAEICDFKGVHRNGHLYFGLKDDKSQIRAVMWKGALSKLKFDLNGGLEVIATGQLDFYGGGGTLQFVVERMEPVGIGALQLRFEQLREKLKSEGLFDADRKRPVRSLNWRIGIVTGKSTAALQDMLKIFRTRFPLAEVFIFHASVQGERAPAEIISAIARANRYSAEGAKPLDALIIARGGGSYEDLFCFNDEGLVRAVAASAIPTVSAIGHEIDFTLCDFVADKRSATPSHAAQETVPEGALWLDRLAELTGIFERRTRENIGDYSQRLDTLYERLLHSAPHKKLEAERKILESREAFIKNLVRQQIERRRAQLQRISAQMEALSPLKVLGRGYTFVQLDEGGAAVKSASALKPGQKIRIRFNDGEKLANIL